MFKSRLLCGEADLVAPRLTNVPVRLPLPPAKRTGSIYESQLELKNSYFGTADAPRTANPLNLTASVDAIDGPRA